MKCCNITAGMLREPIEIQQQVTTDIGGGASSISYTTRANVRGMVKPLSGSERLYAERLDAITRMRVVIRYRSDILESDRLVIRNKSYQIRFINNIEFKDKFLELDLDGGVPT